MKKVDNQLFLQMRMLNSYSRYIGAVQISKVNGSPEGVMIDARIMMAHNA